MVWKNKKDNLCVLHEKNNYLSFYFHSPVDEAALSFQSGLMDEHDAVSEVLSPGKIQHAELKCKS